MKRNNESNFAPTKKFRSHAKLLITITSCMMESKNFAVFSSSFADDSVEEGDDVVVPSGRNIMEAILSKMNVSCSTIEQRSFYGWEFTFSLSNGKTRATALIQKPHSWLLTVYVDSGFFASRSKKETQLVEAISYVKDVAGCSDVRWMSEEEFNCYRSN